MLTRLHLSIILVLAISVWAAVLWFLGIPITWEYLIPFTVTLTVLTGAVFVFDQWLWKLFIFRGWLVKRPNLHGTWKVKLQSNYVDPKTKKTIKPINCFMVVTQTFSKLNMRLHTEESSSVFVASNIIQHQDGVFEIIGVYQNEPDIHLRGERSEIHYGALKLRCNGMVPNQMSGHYWTDRETKGSLELTNKNKQLIASYGEGKDLT